MRRSSSQRAASSTTPARSPTPGREIRQRIKARTDDLAAPPYATLTPAELNQLIADLEPLAAALAATGSPARAGRASLMVRVLAGSGISARPRI